MNSVMSEYRIMVRRKQLHGNSFTVINIFFLICYYGLDTLFKYIILCTDSTFFISDNSATEIMIVTIIVLIQRRLKQSIWENTDGTRRLAKADAIAIGIHCEEIRFSDVLVHRANSFIFDSFTASS